MNRYENKTGGFKSLGQFLVTVRKYYDGDHKDNRLIFGKTVGHMVEGEDSQGGALVPEQWADEIYYAALENSIVRSRATVLPAKSDSLKIRKFVETDRSSNLFGGVTFTWTEELGDKTAAISKPALGELELNPHKLVGGCWVTNELEDDYGKFGDFMKLVFGLALAFVEDDAFLWGTGAGTPLGAIHASNGSLIPVTRSGVGFLDWTDIAHMAERLLPRSWETAVWLINPGAIDELLEATAPVANQATILDLSERKLWGIPFIPTEKCQAMGTQGDIALCDFGHGHYLIADREMRIAASRHVPGSYGFTTDETFWKIVLRVDGQPLMTVPITPYRGANTLSAFIVLTTTS
ncbi:MAG: phage major capsid protein [Candidatus Aminicenantes bacterium]|nr:phage major capsid protein [Candidatus Aminicenantes bacterium]